MARTGNTCGCGRMAFAISDIAVSNPDDPKVTLVLPDLVRAQCLGCGVSLLMGKDGPWEFQPISITSTVAKERLANSVLDAFAYTLKKEEKPEAELVGASS